MALGRHPMVDPSRNMMQPRPDVPRSAFDTRDFHKTTFGHGAMVPIFVHEVLPGDSLRVKMSALVRLATPIVPVMDNLRLHSWFFFVPYRLCWQHWEQFIAGPTGPADTTGYLIPKVNVVNADCTPGTVFDYMGVRNLQSGNTISPSALPFRALELIYQHWFRDQALESQVLPSTGDGPDTATGTYGMHYLMKTHDYFTSARPWPQAATNVQENMGLMAGTASQMGGRYTFGGVLGYGVGAPVYGIGVDTGSTTVAAASTKFTGGRTITPAIQQYTQATTTYKINADANNGFPDVRVLVNDLRSAMAIQRVLEHQAVGGGRYTEYLRKVFGVTPQDARLQRPELLGMGTTMVSVNPVAQTSASAVSGANFSASTKLGQLAAAGYIAARDHGFSHSFPEHGIVIGYMATRTDLTYQAGVDRWWWRNSPFDFYRPELAHLGEQAITSREIYCDGSAGDSNIFGYQERWGEYRTRLSRTSGYMNSHAASPIDMWHFAEKFASRPALNYPAFIAEPADGVTRVLQASAPYSAQFFGDVMFEVRQTRPLPMFSVPGVGDRL